MIDRLDGSVLRYSMRLQLLRIGMQLGLSRFDACLIIAQVQHRAADCTNRATSTLRDAVFIEQPPQRAGRLAPYLVAGLLQLCIFVGAWVIVS